MSSEEREKLITVEKDGLHIVSEKVAESLENKKLSASLISGIEKCPASWVADAFAMREITIEEPDNAARRGSLYHKIMEDFFTLEPEDRTKENLSLITNNVLESDEFKDMQKFPEAMKWLKKAIQNYYAMGAKPQLVKIASIKDKNGVERKGLEVFVEGKVGNTKRNILGFIDRLVVDTRGLGDSVVIEDWKTGGKAKIWNPKTKSTDGLSEARQQIIYSILLKDYGLKVSGARLIFPMAIDPKWKAGSDSTPAYLPTVVPVDLNDEDLKKKVIDSVEEADNKLQHMEEQNTFEYQPQVFCAWCSLAKICPQASIKPYAKMQEAYSSQPEPEDLLKVFDVRS